MKNDNAIAEIDGHVDSKSATHPGSETLDEIFELSDVEMETMRRACQHRGLAFDSKRRSYTQSELIGYGLVRERYTRTELTKLGFAPGEISCFDAAAKVAEELLAVAT